MQQTTFFKVVLMQQTTNLLLLYDRHLADQGLELLLLETAGSRNDQKLILKNILKYFKIF